MNLVERAKNILLAPAKEWEVIKKEQLSTADMFLKYAVILAAIPAIAGFIGQSLIGRSVWGVHFNVPIGNGLFWAILMYVLGLAGLYLLAFVIDVLAPSFGAKKDMNASLKVAIFSYTAAWIAGIFNLIPALSVLAILGSLYSLFLLYLGLKIVKEPPADKLIGYFVVALIVMVVVYFVIGLIVSSIALGGIASVGGFRAY